MLDKRSFYIDGAWVPPAAPNDIEVLDPATEKPIAVISAGSQADADKAVAAAKRAFATWSRTDAGTRLDLLERLLAVYRRRYEEMAQTITAELGAPITMSREQQTDVGVGHLEGFIDANDTPYGLAAYVQTGDPTAPSGWPRGCAPAWCTSTAARTATAARSAATSSRATAARAGASGWRIFWR